MWGERQEAKHTNKGPVMCWGSLCLGGYWSLRGEVVKLLVSISCYINYFYCGHDQILTRGNIKALLWLTAWGYTFHHGTEGMAEGIWGSCRIISSQEAEETNVVVLSSPAPFYSVWDRVHRIVMATSKVDLAALVQLSRNIHACTSSSVSIVILTLDKLAMKINHHTDISTHPLMDQSPQWCLCPQIRWSQSPHVPALCTCQPVPQCYLKGTPFPFTP